MQLEAGTAVEAEATYRTELKEHPHNGWSLLGLQQALKAQGKPTGEVDKRSGEGMGAVRHLDPRLALLGGTRDPGLGFRGRPWN